MLLLICFCVSGCNIVEPDHKYRQAVRDYLSEKGYVIASENMWFGVDSVFSPFNAELSYEYMSNRLWNEIDELYFESAGFRFTLKEHKALMDSIHKKRQLIDELRESLETTKTLRHKNRIGIEFDFTEKDGKEHDLVFVFNNDGETVGHVMSPFSDVAIELYPKMILP